jgi:epoxyqueuosine reductase
MSRKNALSSEALKAALIARAAKEGFDIARITRPAQIGEAGTHLLAFLDAGWHGDMAWMTNNTQRRSDPAALWPDVQSIIMLGMNYGPEQNPRDIRMSPERGAFSVYAHGRDYHDVIKGKQKVLAGWLAAQTDEAVKVFVDTAPVMEKPLAQAAGIGWQGKHTNLVSRDFGSWLFLGAIFTATDLPQDTPSGHHCGICQRCLEICPTKAFPAPYQLDARRCISYLTIEYKGHIPRLFREAIGNRVYGCDDCLAICPWNRFTKATNEAKFAAGPMINAPLQELVRLSDEDFRKAFSGSPIKRIGRSRFIRNVLIAIGNSGEVALLPEIVPLLKDDSPLVRAMAVWAIHRLPIDLESRAKLRQAALHETDENVQAEWTFEKEKQK